MAVSCGVVPSSPAYPKPFADHIPKTGGKRAVIGGDIPKTGGNEWLKNIRPPHFFSDPKNRQNQTGRGFAAFFTRKNRCDLFLIKQGKVGHSLRGSL